MSDPKPKSFSSGFVSIAGRPNAGKSTLLNQLVGTKLAIVADKPQTTRTSVQGVWTTDSSQVVFLDTPGIHRSDTVFNKRMMGEVRSALQERDLLLYVADATNEFEQKDEQALDLIRKAATPVFFILNKIDRVQDKRELLPILERYQAVLEFEEYIPVSALTGLGIDTLRDAILKKMPAGPSYYDAEHVTDQPERFMAAEFIREKIIKQTRQEVPHSVAVLVDHWEEKKSLTSIIATVYVEREGQKGIIIGKAGATLKTIGTHAREDIEKLLGRKVFLQLQVKVYSDWREKPEFLNQLDWRTMAGGEPE